MSLIDDILGRLNIVDIIGQYVDLKKSGSNYKGVCPFHNEKTPSFMVSEDKQIFKCFGCGKGGNLISFVKEFENIEFYETLKILSEKAGLEMKDYRQQKGVSQEELDLKTRLINTNKTAMNYFHKKVFEDENAMQYLKNVRKLEKEIIIKYKIGFAGKQSSDFINYMKNKGFSDDDLIKSGLAKKSSSGSLYSFFSNRIIFPIFSSLGEVVAFSGRIFNGETNTGKYINTAETPIYNKSSILYNYNNAKKTKQDFIIVCEGYMDVIGLDKLGYENVVASCGTALTEKHLQLLKRVSHNIIFAFDADEAGFQASLRGTKIALSMEIYPWIYQIHGGKDFDDIANQNGEINIEEDKQDETSFLIYYFLKDFEKKSPGQKQEKLNQVFDIIKQIGNFNIFWDYLEKIGKIIKQDPNIIYQQIKSKKVFIKKENNTKNNDNQYTIPALFYKNFWKNISQDLELEEIEKDLKKNAKLLPDSILKNTIENNIQNTEKEKILEKQLEWENNLDSRDQEKKDKNIKNEIKKYLTRILIDVFKNPNTKDKMEIMNIINKLRK